jgi:hypothetical protein
MILYKQSYIKQIDDIYKRNKDVTTKEIHDVLKCDYNHIRMRLAKLRYDDGKENYKPYMCAPPPTKDSRHHDSNRWHDIEEDIKHVNVDELYKQATR